MNFVRLHIILSTILLIITLSGCTYRELEMRPETGNLRINLSWESPNPPDQTEFYFYREGSSEPYVATGTTAGYSGSLPAGTYSVVISNKGMIGASYRVAGSYEDDEISIDEERNSDNNYITNIANVYGTGLTSIVIPNSETTVEKVAYPKTYVCYVSLTVRPESMVELSDVVIELTGIVYSVRAYDGEPNPAESRTMRASVPKNTTGGDYSTTLSVFGFTGTNVIHATANANGVPVQSEPKDITEELATLPEEGGTIIIPIPFPNGGSITIEAIVRPWGWGEEGNIIIQ